MESELSCRPDAQARGDLVREALRDARVQLSVLNHHIGSRLDVRDTDFDCLDLISIHGPLSPSELARRAGVRPATMTGILDRLERGGWIVRGRDAADRRAVVLDVLPDRDTEVLDLYTGMNRLLEQICDEYDDPQIEAIITFLRKVQDAGAVAATEIAHRD